MTRVPIDDPDYFLSRARNAMARSEEMPDIETKAQMLSVAQSYVEMAVRAEQRQKGEAP